MRKIRIKRAIDQENGLKSPKGLIILVSYFVGYTHEQKMIERVVKPAVKAKKATKTRKAVEAQDAVVKMVPDGIKCSRLVQIGLKAWADEKSLEQLRPSIEMAIPGVPSQISIKMTEEQFAEWDAKKLDEIIFNKALEVVQEAVGGQNCEAI